MRYEWTPASEPPDSERTVLVWFRLDAATGGMWGISSYSTNFNKWAFVGVTHWRDVAPPTATPRTASVPTDTAPT